MELDYYIIVKVTLTMAYAVNEDTFCTPSIRAGDVHWIRVLLI